ncbi:rhodanese-like domain-containing protein [Lactococcus protaetiae]|uniref:Rhodanese-like domain-containing protein n=1 Tax=Lactococcus protaetiae TaxID=2592653 RepID=A0A514Z901_9LACT|nr:rhodanese-like domain-containing protein [Lactococcus protaetiae]QDK71056.1 rhodanese-like domain-containing protein [Lactococcus protaetiae]
MKTVKIQELTQAMANKAVIVDVRESNEYKAGHVPTAKNIPLSELATRVNEVENGAYIICQSGARSKRACQFLESKGLDVTNVSGGTLAWKGNLVNNG